MATERVLNTVIFMGSARATAPMWGGDVRLGDRVLQWIKAVMADRRATLGTEVIRHDIQVLDPKEVFAPGSGGLAEISSGEMTTPTFFLKELPPKAQALKEIVEKADCYLIISPEYNHTIPPALSSIMGHFGGSCYTAKPSAIVTYSPGPWGGMRAAMDICTMCHELGCLPVTKLTGIPTVSSLLHPDGSPIDPSHRMLSQLPEMLVQLEWMAVAMKNQRNLTGKF
jgi:chromate reductase, NAD(P)H dehydrogenase (quinone)